MVERVDLERAAADVGRRQDPRDPRPGHEPHGMGLCRTEAPARTLVPVDVLDQRAAGEHIHRLQPAADAEHGQMACLGRGPRLGLELVAIPVDLARALVRVTVTCRVDVRAARQEQAVHLGQRRRSGGRVGPRGDRHGPRALTTERREVQVVAACREVGIGLVEWIRDGHDDARLAEHGRRVPRAPERVPGPPVPGRNQRPSSSSSVTGCRPLARRPSTRRGRASNVLYAPRCMSTIEPP